MKAPADRKMKEFIDGVIGESRIASTRIQLSWELLVQIKAVLLSSPTYTHAREFLGIHKNTWHRWKQEGEEIAKSLQDEEIGYPDLEERQKQLIVFVYYLRVSKQKMIRSAWRRLEKLSEKDYRALQFQLKVLDPETFNIEAKMKLSGQIDTLSETEQERVSNVLKEFMPKEGVEDLDGERTE